MNVEGEFTFYSYISHYFHFYLQQITFDPIP